MIAAGGRANRFGPFPLLHPLCVGGGLSLAWRCGEKDLAFPAWISPRYIPTDYGELRGSFCQFFLPPPPRQCPSVSTFPHPAKRARTSQLFRESRGSRGALAGLAGSRLVQASRAGPGSGQLCREPVPGGGERVFSPSGSHPKYYDSACTTQSDPKKIQNRQRRGCSAFLGPLSDFFKLKSKNKTMLKCKLGNMIP